MSDSDFCTLPLTEWARLNDELAETKAQRDRLRAVLADLRLDIAAQYDPDDVLVMLAKIDAALAKAPQP